MSQGDSDWNEKKVIPAGRPGVPNPVDIHVGSRIRLRRTLLGLSQERLGDSIGLTFQQVQKYERGTNRVGASRLYDLSRVLDVPLQFFFDDMPGNVMEQAPRLRAGLADAPAAEFEADPMAKRETLELVRAYYKVKDPHVRKRIFELCKAMAHSTSNAEED
ncbi:MAG: helix-turn-helix transcriptional regulator [Alphaproteobacteria bacterium]|nr:helix-turn-helix transcriptional regulator [Alphaproteobacteria bacterium]